jgi:septal ring factor EnvC (AmiA/AmiB activator)
MTEQIWEADWICENPELAKKAITELQTQVQELESKLKYANTKIANLEKQNKEFKMTIKDMDRRIMRGLRD